MSRLFSAICALTLLLGATVYAQGNVSGSWELSINGPEGVINANADLKQDGEKLTGTITAPQGSAEMTGTMKGKALMLTFSMQGPQGPLEIKVNGEVEGDSIKGILDFGMGMADFTAKKK